MGWLQALFLGWKSVKPCPARWAKLNPFASWAFAWSTPLLATSWIFEGGGATHDRVLSLNDDAYIRWWRWMRCLMRNYIPCTRRGFFLMLHTISLSRSETDICVSALQWLAFPLIQDFFHGHWMDWLKSITWVFLIGGGYCFVDATLRMCTKITLWGDFKALVYVCAPLGEVASILLLAWSRWA